jgi:hypothetical protein
MKRLIVPLLVLPAAWLALLGCEARTVVAPPPAAPKPVAGVAEPSTLPGAAPKAGGAVPVVAVSQAEGGAWGDITGRIIWGGDTVPPQGDLNLKENPDKAACTKDGPVKDETWIINPKNKGIRNTFVWLEGQKKGDKLPIHADLKKVGPAKVEVDQPACAFIPHAVALREGQALVAKNSSGIGHNFKWTGNPTVNPGGNVLLPPGASKDIDDLKADRIPVAIECNIHPWMKGWARVYDHPYYAVTDADGNFTIKNAPVGEFRMKIWHGSSGWLGGVAGKDGEPITIKGGQNKLNDKPFPPPPAD